MKIPSKMTSRSSHQRYYIKRLFLRISQYSKDNTFWSATLLKRLLHGCFSVNIAKFLRTPILTNKADDENNQDCKNKTYLSLMNSMAS